MALIWCASVYKTDNALYIIPGYKRPKPHKLLCAMNFIIFSKNHIINIVHFVSSFHTYIIPQPFRFVKYFFVPFILYELRNGFLNFLHRVFKESHANLILLGDVTHTLLTVCRVVTKCERTLSLWQSLTGHAPLRP